MNGKTDFPPEAKEWMAMAKSGTHRHYGYSHNRNAHFYTVTRNAEEVPAERIVANGDLRMFLVNASYSKEATLDFTIAPVESRVDLETAGGQWSLPPTDPDASVWQSEFKSRQMRVTSTGEETLVASWALANGPKEKETRSGCYVVSAPPSVSLRDTHTKLLGERKTGHATEDRNAVNAASFGVQVLSLCTEWFSRHGGLPTFNRQLCKALAASGNSVVCYVPTATAEERQDAEKNGIKLVTAEVVDSSGSINALGQRPAIGEDWKPSFILGHDRQTGAVAHIQKQHFPEAKLVHFIHTAPAELEPLKKDAGDARFQRAEDRTNDQVELARHADLIAAVGPRLRKEIDHALCRCRTPIPRTLNFVPGLDPRNGHQRKVSPVTQCLITGRMEDATIKGIDVAVAACDEAMALLKNEKISLLVRGVEPGKGGEFEQLLAPYRRGSARVDIRYYSEDETTIEADMMQSSILLMPSRVEGFGLVGLEAIGLGMPVLVSEESGLAEFLLNVLPAICRNSILPVTQDLDETARHWGERIAVIARDRSTAFEHASKLRDALAPICSWQKSWSEILNVTASPQG